MVGNNKKSEPVTLTRLKKKKSIMKKPLTVVVVIKTSGLGETRVGRSTAMRVMRDESNGGDEELR